MTDNKRTGKRTLSLTITQAERSDGGGYEDLANELVAIFDEYLDAVLAMDVGDRMTLRDPDGNIVGRAEITSGAGDLPTDESYEEVKDLMHKVLDTVATLSSPAAANTPRPDLPRPEHKKPGPPLRKAPGRVGDGDFSATFTATEQGDLPAEGD